MYAITATISYEKNGWMSSNQVPTFFLNENVQGILSEEQAVSVAYDILRAGAMSDAIFSITAVAL